MHWNIDRQGRVIGENAASDADQDIAMSLAFAHAKWGSNTTLDYLG
jgi:endo-1,4-beta-D-glucanase Y